MPDERENKQQEMPQIYRPRFMEDESPDNAPRCEEAAHQEMIPENTDEAQEAAPAPALYCTRCGTSLQSGQAYCHACGRVCLPNCPVCGKAVIAGQPFCSSCGHQLQPAPPRKPVPPGIGAGIPGMVLGISGLVFSWVPVFGLFLLIPGLILGIVAKRKGCRGMATAAIVCSVIGLVIQVLILIAIFASVMGSDTIMLSA